ncbi:aryl-alcohol dehydrogenase [Halobacteriales archaeon QH_8_67_36]|nr:MAG: aryl-alcohol dehydrogenase [Halobacteriales archaeon QH_8_67_36]
MEYTRLGSTGTTVSQLCYGTWRFGRETGGVVETDREQAHELLDAAWERGINFFDTANVYGTPNGKSERYIGEWLDDRDREDVVIASKVYFPFDGWGEPGPNDSGLGRKHIRAQIAGTLDRLDTDYLDLYYIHRWDEESNVVETLRTLNDLVREGTVHYLGASTMAADYLDVAADQDMAVCPYSPLAGGFLTGKYERTDDDDPTKFEGPDGARGSLSDRFDDFYLSERGWHVLDEIKTVADELDATPPQVALRWLIEQPDITCVPIVGARTVDQLDENVGATDISLSDDQFNRIVSARYADDGERWGHRE